MKSDIVIFERSALNGPRLQGFCGKSIFITLYIRNMTDGVKVSRERERESLLVIASHPNTLFDILYENISSGWMDIFSSVFPCFIH